MIHISAIDEVRRLPQRVRYEIRELVEEVHRLKILLRPPMIFPTIWNLTAHESRTLAAIYAGRDKPVSMPRLIHAVYGDDEPEFSESSLGLFILHVRRKLKPFGVTIVNVHGLGWHLDAWSCEFVRKAIEGK